MHETEEMTPQPQPQKPRRGRQTALTLLALAAVGVLSWQLIRVNDQLHRMQVELNSLQHAVSGVNTEVAGQIAGIGDRVEEILQAQNDLTADYGCAHTETDIRADTAHFTAYAVPKRYVSGMTATFFAESAGETIAVPGAPGAGNRFDAALAVPLSDLIRLSVCFDADGAQETQLLDAFSGLKNQTIPYIEFDLATRLWGMTAQSLAQPHHDFTVLGTYNWVSGKPLADYRLTNARAWLTINGGAPLDLALSRDTIPSQNEAWVEFGAETPGTGVAAQRPELDIRVPALDLAPGDVLNLYLSAEDTLGRTLEVRDATLRVSADGRLDFSEDGGEYGTYLVE